MTIDGTLLPFEQDDFVKIYFSELCRKLAPMGYEPQHTVKSVWGGTKAMVMNDGSRLNSEAFWETFNAMNPGLPGRTSRLRRVLHARVRKGKGEP